MFHHGKDIYPQVDPHCRYWPSDCTSYVKILLSSLSMILAGCVGLAADGMDIAVNDIPAKLDNLKQVVGEIEALGRKAIAIPGDVSKEAEVRALVKQTVDALGGLDVVCVQIDQTRLRLLIRTKMVANAGVMPKPESVLDRK